MFTVSVAEATAIRIVFDEKGEMSAAIELRRLFPGIRDNVEARRNARLIVGWDANPFTAKHRNAVAPTISRVAPT